MEFEAKDILSRMKAALKNEDTRLEGSFSMDNLQAVAEELARYNAMRIRPLWDEIERNIAEVITSGNERHYEYWAKQPEDETGKLIGNARAKGVRDGSGVVNVACITPDGKAPSPETLKKVRDYIDSVRPVGALPNVIAGELLDVTVSGTIEIYDGAEISEIRAEAATKIGDYLSSLLSSRDKSVLNYHRIGTLISETAGVKEVLDFTVNGKRKSLESQFSQFFTLKEVALNVPS